MEHLWDLAYCKLCILLVYLGAGYSHQTLYQPL